MIYGIEQTTDLNNPETRIHLRRGDAQVTPEPRLLTEACERGVCGNCYKGHDQEYGWCQCACHPEPPRRRSLGDRMWAWLARYMSGAPRA